MRTSNEYMKYNILALAVQGALIAMFTLPMVSQAEEAGADETAVLTHPTNSVRLGVASVSKESAKFGEYNGLGESKIYGIANINLQGGSGYDESDTTTRWQIKGVDLGTTSREVGAELSNQGQWNVGIKFDELRHNFTDSYQTPYIGQMGGDNFTLPSTFGLVTVDNSGADGTRSLSPDQLSAFHTEKIYTTRENTSITAGYTINPQWSMNLDLNHLNQKGAKLMAFSANGQNGSTGETISILPNPTNYSTDSVNLALNWKGDKSHVNLSYFGSFFRNDYDRVTFDSYIGAKTTQTMSTAPGNDFNQLNLLGGYSITDKTKLAGGLSYGRGTQNDPFVSMGAMMITTPQRTSFDGVVITTHADFKLTNQTINKLTLTAGLKYDERDNKSPSNIYNFNAVSGSNPANYPNTPLSNRKTQYELAADYRLTSNQHLRLAYNRENVQRWCNNYATGGATPVYAAGTSCVVADSTKDDKLSATYKLNATEDVHLNAGYSYSDRNSNFNPFARSAFVENANIVPASPFNATGLNGGDFLGFHPFFTENRIQQVVKGGVDWQATDKLNLNANGRYTDDNYNSTYGFQNGNTWSMNLDAMLQYSENGKVNAYVTKERRERGMTNLQALSAISASLSGTSAKLGVPAGGTWSNTLTDDDVTFGLGAKQAGLMGGKFDLGGDLTYSLGQTNYSTLLNYNGVDTRGNTCSSAGYLTCGSVPEVKNRLIQLKINGNYKVNKSGTVGLDYIYQNLSSNDYYYNAYQYGYTPQKVLPTNQQTGAYTVNLVTATYTYNF
jgi:MtrB/PioB family decaheme-associated outer membrane protein